jgi:hypothetical protein
MTRIEDTIQTNSKREEEDKVLPLSKAVFLSFSDATEKRREEAGSETSINCNIKWREREQGRDKHHK